MTKRIAALAATIVLVLPAVAGAREDPYGKGERAAPQLRHQIAHKRAHRAPVAVAARSSWS